MLSQVDYWQLTLREGGPKNALIKRQNICEVVIFVERMYLMNE